MNDYEYLNINSVEQGRCLIFIGTSKSNTKVVDFEYENIIVDTNPVNKQDPAWEDRFEVKIDQGKLLVKRIDCNAGWGQPLVLSFRPKADDRTENELQQSKSKIRELSSEIMEIKKQMNKMKSERDVFETENEDLTNKNINLKSKLCKAELETVEIRCASDKVMVSVFESVNAINGLIGA